MDIVKSERKVTAVAARPIEGLVIAIDPGHIGGDYSEMEARHFKIGEAPPVKEGDLTLIVCNSRVQQVVLGAAGDMSRIEGVFLAGNWILHRARKHYGREAGEGIDPSRLGLRNQQHFDVIQGASRLLRSIASGSEAFKAEAFLKRCFRKLANGDRQLMLSSEQIDEAQVDSPYILFAAENQDFLR